MKSLTLILTLFLILPASYAAGQVVVDASTRRPLPGASVFDARGRLVGVADGNGCLPHIVSGRMPLTLRCLGYSEKTVAGEGVDTVFMSATSTALPEVIVESPRLKVLHVLGYVREYSTLSTMTDTVFLFREKMVDFMLTPDRSMKFKGWKKPRVLKSESYYRFTDRQGLDSVSNRSGHHFSWSDWVGIVPSPHMPEAIKYVECGSDTLRGKYSAAELWHRDNSRVTVDVDVLADAACRRWVPEFAGFFNDNLDFQKFKVKIDYRNVTGDEITVRDLAGYSFTIESEGRGRDMFMFNRKNERISVTTYAEVYVVDREFISVKEARKWKDLKFDTDALVIVPSPEAPPLQPFITELIARVEGIDHTGVRLDFNPDERLAGGPPAVENIGTRILNVLKVATGISQIRGKRNFERRWRQFAEQCRERNHVVKLTPKQPLESGDESAQGSEAEGQHVEADGEGQP
ncbi:MAG: carboxypeptidase-like regulatory domain-containing protein [Duncaniella sp.]|nr:carboxypeptidase-like regulatory domain-containing protein [Duncaniella sp.]